ncbi:hypothetical protein [Bauldia sp.]|uniref:hypothetical protein n=1 Tax=Bauldia sp. TaxID=2575872 RepID=UPI0025C339BC|nr:hypothetical protein [Bauldia sp.]
MIGRWTFHGHAIVSEDDRIAGADGLTPDSLRNEADWRRFQSALDTAAVTILGRLGHEVNPNPKRRRRLVMSRSVAGLERHDDGWWWNPAGMSIGKALAEVAPEGGVAAIPGGREVFDFFLETGFDRFDLARVAGVRIAGGIPIFSSVSEGRSAAGSLAAHGLRPAPPEVLDAAAGVSVTRWQRTG